MSAAVSTSLSLWKIESDLAELFQMREDAAEAILTAPMETLEDRRGDLALIDTAIADYCRQEIRKVDGVRAVWKHLEDVIANARAEAKLQQKRAWAAEENLERLKANVQAVMESMPWVPGKSKMLEGRTGKLYLKGNGGCQAVHITDETLVPDEFMSITTTMSMQQWNLLVACAGVVQTSNTTIRPALALIGEALLTTPVAGCRLLERGQHLEIR